MAGVISSWSISVFVSFTLDDDIARITTNCNTLQYSTIISSVYFGDIRVTNFEVIDNNTIKVIVPSGVNGDYEINLVDIRSGISAKTGLIYTYIDDSNNDNTKELEEPEDIVAPNTGYKK